MKRIKLYVLVVICSLFAFAACEGFFESDLLDTVNPNEPTEDVFWETEDDATRAINAIYNRLQADGMYTRWAQVHPTFRSDGVKGDSPAGFMQNMGFFREPANQTWDAAYQGVFRANLALDRIPDMDIDESLKNRLIGEARFLRGFMYYTLVNFFRNVPLILEVPETEEDYQQPQADPQDVWAQVISDFQAAKEALPGSYGSGDIGRATRYAAAGYLARSYLYTVPESWGGQDHFTLANDELEEIINSGQFALVEDYASMFNGLNQSSEEVIFEVQFDQALDAALGGQTYWLNLVYAPRGFGWNDALPTEGIWNAFNEEQTEDGDDDPRLQATIFYDHSDVNLYGNSWNEANMGPDELHWKKWTNSDRGAGGENPDNGDINYILLRYADVLLMYAETQNELGNPDVAAEYIQMVRDRANMPDREAEFAQMSQEELRDRIAHERFVEFELEGLRFFDIRRWGWLEDPEKLEMLQENDHEFEDFFPGREWWPIPQGELDTNPLLEQNPTWG